MEEGGGYNKICSTTSGGFNNISGLRPILELCLGSRPSPVVLESYTRTMFRFTS